jgi:hypothetical protein
MLAVYERLSTRMPHPPDASTSQERYGLVLEESPGRASIGISFGALPAPRSRARELVADGLALAYLAAIGGLALRAVRWLTGS